MSASPDDQFITAFTEIQSSLRAFCVASIGHSEDANDIFQKTCLALWKKADERNSDTPFLAWALTVARYEVLSHIRDRSREKLIFDDDVIQAMTGTSERLAENFSDRAMALEACLKRLKPEQRALLTDFHVHRLSLREISQQHQRGLSAVKVMLMRLRNSLGDCIQNRIAGQAS